MHMAAYKGKRNELRNVIDALNGRLTGIQQELQFSANVRGRHCVFVTPAEARRVVDLLRRYAEAWRADHYRWDLKNPRLFRQFKRAIEHTHTILRDRAFLRRHAPWKKFTHPFVGLTHCAATPEEYAATLFLSFQHLMFDLGVNSINQCARCGTYFVNRFGHRGRKFCSHACAVAQTVGQSRRVAYAEKLGRVAELMRTGKPGKDWKGWVDTRTGGKGDTERISQNWLTHAIHRGLLTETGRLTPEGRALTRQGAAG
jgi:hypothetical protein